MDGPDTDYVIHINGAPVETLSVEEGEYYTVPDTESRSLSIACVELFDPNAGSVVRFGFARSFAVPKGEEGMLCIVPDDEDRYRILHYACGGPGYLEEHRDLYAWDEDSRCLSAANFIGGEIAFKSQS